MAELAVTALGADRPGIVAVLAETLHQRGANVEDVGMTTLEGHFAVLLQVDVDDEPADLETALHQACTDLGVVVAVRPAVTSPLPVATHLLSVFGHDQPGLLATVTRAVADTGATIVDLAGRTLPENDDATYALSLELVVPPDHPELADHLADACDRLGVDHTLRAVNGEVG